MNYFKIITFTVILFLLRINCIAQNEIDSLKEVLKKTNNKIEQINLYGEIGDFFIDINLDSAIHYLNIAKKEALTELAISKSDTIEKNLATTFNNLGITYSMQGDVLNALKSNEASLKIREKINDKLGTAESLNNIAMLYIEQGDTKKSLIYTKKALKIYSDLNDKEGIANSYNNIGYIYDLDKDYRNALSYYKKALKITEEINLKDGTAYILNNIANIYSNNGNFKSALIYHKKALKIHNENKDQYGAVGSIINIGKTYWRLKNIKKAKQYGLKAYKISKNLNLMNEIKESCSLLRQIEEKQANYKKAYFYFKEEIKLKDSIVNESNQKAIFKQQAKYEYEKQAAIDSIANAKQLKIKNLQIEKINAEKKAKTRQRNMFLLGFVLISLFAVFIIRMYVQKKKANILLALQKQEIQEANEELNQQNEEIISQRNEIESQRKNLEIINFEVSQSIDYAKRLQHSILPDEKALVSLFSDFFVLFKPKSKVSGDFYWWTQINNYTIITAADCTGHGVPGAFMSMLGVSFLREIVQKEKISNTDKILQELRAQIITALKQKGEIGEQKDGMDMAIISINNETNEVQFSGANNPLYIITENKIPEFHELNNLDNKTQKFFYEIKPDKMPIAFYDKMDNFTSNKIKLQKGDCIYMFSDGFADQFGGDKNKKFKYKPFKQLLLNNANKSMKEQKQILTQTFEEWKGKNEQTDDVVVIGVTI